MPDALVSIVIPVYNGGERLKECLRSVLGQSYTNLEVVCIDDGSTDGSGDYLIQLSNSDSRLVAIRQENRGVGAARNRGINAASGGYLVFVDADDCLKPSFVETYVREMSDPVDLVIGGRASYGIYTTGAEREEFLYAGLRATWINPPWGRMFRASIIAEKHLRFHEDVSLGEDLLFNLEYALHARVIKGIPEDLYVHSKSNGSLTRSFRPTKAAELGLVHERLRELLVVSTDVDFSAVLNYLKIKSLISCCNTFLSSSSPLSKVEAELLCVGLERENPSLPVSSGDGVMRTIGLLYSRIGLWRLSRIVRMLTAGRYRMHAIRRIRD